MTKRERLQGAQWDSLDAMTAGYAAHAVELARSDFHETLDYSAASLDRLERILNRLCPAPDPLPQDEGEWLTTLWGSYFGETLRRLHGGEWTMSIYPGSTFAVPTLEVASGSRLYPLMKVHRRLTMGADESLPAFYTMVVARLGAGKQS
jgi:hypothetical protein